MPTAVTEPLPVRAAVTAASPAPSLADQKGLVCRQCGCRHFRVVYTRAAWGGRIARRRECRNCGKRVTTWERASC
jgi:hypothetical protein